MTARLDALIRPRAGEDFTSKSKQRGLGFVLALVGLVLVMITLIANISAANGTSADAPGILAWSFGLTTTAFAAIKFGIAVILVGILVRLFLRVESVKAALPDLKAEGDGAIQSGTVGTPLGKATLSATAPGPLPIHKMAKRMWAPMLAMGVMAVVAGLLISFAWAGDPGDAALAAWTQGLQFLGEGFLLAGIAFLLGTILASLREGGGRLQEALGITVKTPNMPATAKAFVGLMMLGVMLAVLQFVLYLVVAAGVDTPAAWFAWLGPLRELSLGLILSGIVLALVTIGNVLDFQFGRIKEIVSTGN
jgi:hypothetical protein